MPRAAPYEREQVVRRATDWFWRHGYHRTSIRDLLRVTGFNRRALYAHFGGKAGLFAAALDDYRVRYIERIVGLLEAPGAGLDALRDLFRLRLGGDPARGCLIMNTLSEQPDRDLQALAAEQNARIEAGVRRCIVTAQGVGDIAAHRDPDALARHVMTLLHGIGPVTRAGMRGEALADMVSELLEGLAT